MKKALLFLTLFFGILFSQKAIAQNVYTTSGGEMIFSWANLELSNNYKEAFPLAEISNTPPRFTMFLHINQHLHVDLGNYFGFFTGTALRNVGFISDEVLPTTPNALTENDYQDYKIIRRLYTLGVPLAIKIGAFDKGTFLYAGGEMEWGFHMKEKYWNSHDRSGDKKKRTQWFPDNTEAFIPSAIAGIQLPKGLNLRFKYYLNDFIKRNFQRVDGDPTEVSNLNRYGDTQVMYVSLSWETKKALKNRKRGKERRSESSNILLD